MKSIVAWQHGLAVTHFIAVTFFLFGVSPVSAQVQSAWVAHYHGPGQNPDVAYDLKVDVAGNIYVAGGSYGGSSYDFTTIKYGPDGQQLWARGYDGPAGLYDIAQHLVLDGAGNVYVMGQSTSISRQKIALVKYSPSGTQLWVARVNELTGSDDAPFGLVADALGNLIVIGGSTRPDPSGAYQFLTVKYAPDGHELWTARYSVSADSYDTPVGVATDAAGNVYVVGRSFSPNTLTELVLVKYSANGQLVWIAPYDGPTHYGAYPTTIAVNGSGDIYVCGSGDIGAVSGQFLLKYNSDGDQLWVATYAAPGAGFGAYASALVLDNVGNVYVGGILGNYYPGDYGTLKYNANGHLLWAARYNGPGNGHDVLTALALDTNGNVYVTGRSWAAETYDDDYATVKYDARGNQLWAARYSSTNLLANDQPFAVALDATGNVYVTGGAGPAATSEFATVKYQQTTIAGLPAMTVPPQGQLVEAGTVVTFTFAATGDGPLLTQWRRNGVPIPDATNAALQIIAAASDIEVDYSVEVRNGLGATVSPEARLSVVSFPGIVSSPVSRAAAPGVDTVFTVQVIGHPPPSYQWFFNGAALPGATNSELVIHGVTASNAGGYFVVISNYLGTATSAVATLTVSASGPLDAWEWRNPLPQGNGLKAVTFGNGLFVGVGEVGAIVTSTDGVTWAVQRSGVESLLQAVAFGNGRFVAAGGGGTVLTSPDGTNWVKQPFDQMTYPNAIAFGNGTFVLASYSYLFSSTDGEHWVNRAALQQAAIYSLAYGKGLFVGVGANDAIFTSSDGISWANDSLAGSPTLQLQGVAYGNNRFVAVGYDTTVNSADGTNWTRVYHGTPAGLGSVAYGNGQFVAVGYNGGARSLDGSTWTYITFSNSVSVIAFGNGLFAAVGPAGAIVTSADTVTWANRLRGVTDNLHAIACGHGLSVAVGNAGTILISSNGLAWNRVNSGVTVDLYGITFANSSFFAVGNNGAMLTSTNGVDWTFRNSGTGSRLHDVVWAGGRYIAVGRNGTTVSSLDGLAWAAHDVVTNTYLRGIAYGNGVYVASGSSGWFFTSLDATNWTPVTAGTGWDLNDVTFGNGLFVAVSDVSFVLTSTDGTAWKTNDLQLDLNLRAVYFANGLYIAAGNNGTLLSSPDGMMWTRRYTGFAENFRGLCYDDSRFTLVGNNGGILQSGSFSQAQLAVRTRPTSAGLELTILGEIGRPYRLQASTDLVNWIDLFSFSNTEAHTLYLDTHTREFRNRFYRVLSP